MMPVVDEYTRECLSIEVERSITAEDIVGTLASLFRSRGQPAFIRADNGPEFVARAIRQWLEVSGVRTLYLEPGAPWENAYSETFISRFSDELLKREVFGDLGHFQGLKRALVQFQARPSDERFEHLCVAVCRAARLDASPRWEDYADEIMRHAGVPEGEE
jgi:transposase InsO family protein